MLFWSFILAFVLGILYYNLYPWSNMVEVRDKPLAESAIIGFVNSHQSAKNALYHFEEDSEGNRVIVLDYVNQMPLVSASKPETDQSGLYLFDPQNPDLLSDKFGHINQTLRNSALIGQPRSRLKDVHSFVACIKVNVNEITNVVTKELTFDCDNDITQNYVVTYMDQPLWWSEDVRKKELWRSAILRRTKGSDECGVLYPRLSAGHAAITGLSRFDKDSEYVLDNSQRYIVSIPKEITATMKTNFGGAALDDLLFCITSVQNIVRHAQKRSQVKYEIQTEVPEKKVP